MCKQKHGDDRKERYFSKENKAEYWITKKVEMKEETGEGSKTE